MPDEDWVTDESDGTSSTLTFELDAGDEGGESSRQWGASHAGGECESKGGVREGVYARVGVAGLSATDWGDGGTGGTGAVGGGGTALRGIDTGSVCVVVCAADDCPVDAS